MVRSINDIGAAALKVIKAHRFEMSPPVTGSKSLKWKFISQLSSLSRHGNEMRVKVSGINGGVVATWMGHRIKECASVEGKNDKKETKMFLHQMCILQSVFELDNAESSERGKKGKFTWLSHQILDEMFNKTGVRFMYDDKCLFDVVRARMFDDQNTHEHLLPSGSGSTNTWTRAYLDDVEVQDSPDSSSSSSETDCDD